MGWRITALGGETGYRGACETNSRSVAPTPVTRRRPRENPRSGAQGVKRDTSFHGASATNPIRKISSCQVIFVIFVTIFAQLLESAEKSPR